MKEIKFKQVYYSSTYYIETLAMFYYAQINNQDFRKIIDDREDYNSFPDFRLKNNGVEVVRATRQIYSKFMNSFRYFSDIKENKELLSKKMEKSNAEFRDDKDYILEPLPHFTYDESSGAIVARKTLPTNRKIVKKVINTIKKKNSKYLDEKKKEKYSLPVDLFVISEFSMNLDMISEVIETYQKLSTVYFNNIYIEYILQTTLEDDTPFRVAIFNKNNVIETNRKLYLDKKIVQESFIDQYVNKKKFKL